MRTEKEGRNMTPEERYKEDLRAAKEYTYKTRRRTMYISLTAILISVASLIFKIIFAQ